MIRINLLPVRAAQKRENIRRQVSYFLGCVILVVVAMAYFTISLNRSISNLTVEIEDAKSELTKLQAIVKRVNQIKKELNKLEAKMDVIARLEANRAGPARIMDALTSLVVADRMWLTKMSEVGGKMNLSGVAMDNKTIADFMTRLEKSPHFNVVDLISSTQVSLEKGKKFKKFTIVCRVSGKGPKAS